MSDEVNTSFKVKVTRAPINYVGPKVEEPPKEKEAAPKPKSTLSPVVKRAKVGRPKQQELTPEEIKKRKAERALHWYNERKNNPELLEKRRQYAREYQAKKRDK